VPPEAREARVLDALEQVISDAGLEAATMNGVARAAGMSKRTLYALYDSRDAMMAAWVRRVRSSLVRALPPEAGTRPLAERLRLLLRPAARHVLSDRRLAVLRAMIGEAPRNPDLARRFHREGAAVARDLIAGELRRAVAAGEIVLPDVETAAAMLFDMAYQSPLDRLINPDASAPTPAQSDRRLDMAITVFLNGTARKPS
jgi:AcrR family transcriptional regulator